jgi:ATP-binding cassette subfamily F protein 3
MAIVTLQDVFKEFDGQAVLVGVSLTLHPGEKIALVGANGAGKTTVFRLIIGDLQPDTGTVTRSRQLRIAFLPQTPQLDSQRSLIEEVGEAFRPLRRMEEQLQSLAHQIARHHDAEHLPRLMNDYDRLTACFEAAGGYSADTRLREVLGGLGFAPDDYGRPVGEFSGGQKCRAALAKLLLQDADLLLLDEPTNHLDLEAMSWLEKFLAAYRGSVVVVSHDRYLLDRVTTKTIELEAGKATTFGCAYSDYAEAKRLRLLAEWRAYEQQSAWLAHQREYAERVKADKSRAGQASGRRAYIQRMQREGRLLDRPPTRRQKMHLALRTAGRGEMVLRCESLGKRFGDKALFDGFDLEMTRGEKIGVIGPNGVGKTTLLRMLLGQVAPDAGAARLFENLRVGHFDQELADLDRQATVLDTVRAVRSDLSEQEARAFLARFLFRGDDVFKQVGGLSGGEQSRVALAKLVLAEPDVLLLDEPTNHLDIPSREVLERALQEYPGSILLISHDRYLLDHVVRRLIVMEPGGRHQVFAGNYSAYVRWREQMAEEQSADLPTPRARPKRPAARSETAPPDEWAEYDLEELEARIIEREEQLQELVAAFGQADVHRDGDRARDLQQRYHALRAELDSLNAAWERRVDRED